MIGYHRYSKEEDAILIANWVMLGQKMAWMLPGRTLKSIQTRAYLLGLTKNSPLWTQKDDELLRTYWPLMGKRCSVHFPNRTQRAVRARADKLKLYRIYDEKKKRKPKPVKPPQTHQKSRDGFPMVSSIFNLAQAYSQPLGVSHE